LRQVASSLAEAHEQGLIHRDIKPHNIFLTRRGNIPDFVKVLDFGLVKAVNVEGQLELTGGNATLGTPLYMSPEAVASPGKVDARSDLYSLGAVAFHLLTGETVFFGSTIGEVMMQQVKVLPEKPSARLSEPLSPDLEELIMSCLAKRPANRPANARELEAALGRCSAASHWGREEAEAWWRKFDAAKSEATVVLRQPTPVIEPCPVPIGGRA
jgi:serine/threonine-protein kinase